MRRVELLAPAGDMESLYAAVQNGADAIYLGGNKFSARAYASNFDDSSLIDAVKYCHYYGVKVYITLNTIVKEKEMQEALKYSSFLYSIGVDAIIIQDSGLIYNLRRFLPELELHASTQMTVHNAEGALFLNRSGLKRIVLSRELSLDEVEYISKNLNIETEIFVHGALCVCYSGQCLLSSIIGGRSGNRGRCAQPCRLPYTLKNSTQNKEKHGYLLSTRDICTLENIKAVIESGASSLKIEGRMKRPEYVAGVISVYRKIIDLYYSGKLNDNFDFKKDYNELLQLFNREGFSKSYLFGNQGTGMMAYSFPKNSGVLLGRVNNDLSLKLEEDINIKDGIRNSNEGFTISKIIKNNSEACSGTAGEKVQIYPVRYKSGDLLYKTLDVKLMEKLRESYKNKYGNKIDLNLQVYFMNGAPIRLITEYLGEKFEYTGGMIEEAVNVPVSKDKLLQNLSKSGEEPFRFSNIDFNEFSNGYIPISSVNEARRELMESVKNYIDKKNEHNLVDININKASKVSNMNPGRKSEKIVVCINSRGQYDAAKELNIKNIAVNPFYRGKSYIELDDIKEPFILKVPNIIRKEFKKICSIIDNNSGKISGLITSNYGIIHKYGGILPIWGDYKLNMVNSNAVSFFENYLEGSCLSIELNKREISDILIRTQRKYQLLIYGKAELMVSEYCPIGCVYGGNEVGKKCNKACEDNKYTLVDRTKEEFLVLTDKYCRSYIFNSKPINLINDIPELKSFNIDYRMDFIDENYEDTKNIIMSYMNSRWEGNFANYTRGHYKRGVE